MSREEQERRRLLKQRRRHLDSIAQAIAAARPGRNEHAPSTRAKQAKANHTQAEALHRRRANYDQMRAEMHAIAAELARTHNPVGE